MIIAKVKLIHDDVMKIAESLEICFSTKNEFDAWLEEQNNFPALKIFVQSVNEVKKLKYQNTRRLLLI